MKAAKPAENIAAWKADGARLLHLGLQNGTAEIARLLAEDLQRSPETKKAVLPTVQIAPGVIADLIAERNDGKLVRYPDGSLHFQASPLALTAQVTTPAVSVATAPVAGSLAQ